MLHLLRNQGKRGGEGDTRRGAALNSHVLSKFLKRLRADGRPHILDLGPLSGANIQFFAELGCKVQVEDLLSVAEIVPPESVAPEPRPAPAPATTTSTRAATSRPVQPVATSIRQPPSRPGARPSRRIILPPRTFPAYEVSREGSRVASRLLGTLPGKNRADRKWRSLMPIHFNFPETSFDAIIAWDVFNYYDPESVRVIAAEVRRVLKPGGLVLAYFDTARTEEPAAPWRYKIVDERRIQYEPMTGRLMLRQVYQNRDIEKMFVGLRIVELYFLKNSMREVLMEKKDVRETPRKAPPKPKPPRPKFTIE